MRARPARNLFLALCCTACAISLLLPGVAGAAILGGGVLGDGQTSLVYDAATGELSLDPPSGGALTSINIDSAAGSFTGPEPPVLGGSFDNYSPTNLFKATFGSSFGAISFGRVFAAGLSEAFLLSDLTVVGSLDGGGDLGAVDLVYVSSSLDLSKDAVRCQKAIGKQTQRVLKSVHKEHAKCLDREAEGRECDATKRDERIAKVLAQAANALDKACGQAEYDELGFVGDAATLRDGLLLTAQNLAVLMIRGGYPANYTEKP
jgi:hypothetical protein